MVDIEDLKRVASLATQGEWWIDSHGHSMVSFVEGDILNVFTTEIPEGVKPTRHLDTGNLSYWRNDNDATYIAIACPKNVLSLISEIETLRLKIKELTGE